MSKALHYIYRNLHTNTFSMMYKQKVVSHPTEIIIKDALLKVSQIGRERVLREKRKNVHAKIGGTPITEIPNHLNLKEIYYDPYKTETFIYKDTKEPVYKLNKVLCRNNRIYEII